MLLLQDRFRIVSSIYQRLTHMGVVYGMYGMTKQIEEGSFLSRMMQEFHFLWDRYKLDFSFGEGEDPNQRASNQGVRLGSRQLQPMSCTFLDEDKISQLGNTIVSLPGACSSFHPERARSSFRPPSDQMHAPRATCPLDHWPGYLQLILPCTLLLLLHIIFPCHLAIIFSVGILIRALEHFNRTVTIPLTSLDI